MIVEHFDFGWQGVKSVELQKHVITTYLQRYYTNQSNTVLINTTWLHSKVQSVTEQDLKKNVLQYAQTEYDIFCGTGWPELQTILELDNFAEYKSSVSNELIKFKEKINSYEAGLTIKNISSPMVQVKEYIDRNKYEIDTVIVYSFLDPPRLLPFLDNQPFEVIKIGGNPKPNQWLDFHAILVDKFFSIDQNLNKTSTLIDIPFMCLNGKPHSHRRDIVAELLTLGLDKLGLVSFGGMHIDLKESSDYIETITIPENHIRPQGINYDPFDAMSLGDIDNWNRHFLNIVTETLWEVERFNWWSEKIFKPIIGHRPFLVYAPNGCTNMLVDHGFQHYCNDFTDISDLDLSQPNNIPTFLKQLSDQPTSYLTMKYDQLFEKIQFNRERFDSYVAEQWEVINQGLV